MKITKLIWVLALVLIASSPVFAEIISTCYIDEGLGCIESGGGSCEEVITDGSYGYVEASTGIDSWVYMRFDETTCDVQPLDFENSSTTKSATLYWWTQSCNDMDDTKFEICKSNDNGDTSIEYCTDDSVLHGGSCSNTENDYENVGDKNNDFINEGYLTNKCSGGACSTSSVDINTNNDDGNYIVYLFNPSSSQDQCAIKYSSTDKPRINVTVNYPPSLTGLIDLYTEENGDASDIEVDLWGDAFNNYHYDPDDSASDNTFTIYSESNTALIDCNITDDQYLLCDPPAANKTGYSDIVVKVDDGYETDTDTIRVTVYDEHDVSIEVNNTKAWSGYSFDNVDADILLDIENYLEVCENNSQGNCLVPVTIKSFNYPIDFSINSIDINYYLYELSFKDALQSYLDNVCSTANCTVPLTFGLESKGQLDLTDLQIFYNDSNASAGGGATASGDTIFHMKDTTGNNVANFTDEGDIVLKGTCNSGGSCTAQENGFNIYDTNGDVVSYIDTNGNLCIEAGDCSDNSPSCNPPENSFYLNNDNGNTVIYIDSTGDLCLIGDLIQNGNP